MALWGSAGREPALSRPIAYPLKAELFPAPNLEEGGNSSVLLGQYGENETPSVCGLAFTQTSWGL